MDFTEYKNGYFNRWQKKLLPSCWAFFLTAVIINLGVSIYFFISGEIPHSRFSFYFITESVIPLSLHLISLIYATVFTKKQKASPENTMKILVWLYYIQTNVVGIFYCRFLPALFFPCTSLILCALLFDKKLLKIFFTLSLFAISLSSFIWMLNFSQYTIVCSIVIITMLYFLDVIVFILAYNLCKLQRELIFTIFKSYMKHKRLNRELRLEPLTRLYNRTAYASAVEKLIHGGKKSEFPLVQVLLDLDNFKEINDTYGHSGGDAVLITLGEMISSCLGKAKLGFRYGGDEFVMIFNDRTMEDAVKTVEKLRNDFSSFQFDFMKEGKFCTMSLGIASYQPGWNSKQWFQAADAAAYIAKTKGKNRLEIAE